MCFILCYLTGSYGTGSAEVDFDSPVEAKLAWLQVRSWLLILQRADSSHLPSSCNPLTAAAAAAAAVVGDVDVIELL